MKACRGHILRSHGEGSLHHVSSARAPALGFGRVLRQRLAESEERARGLLQSAQQQAHDMIADAKVRAEEQFVVQQTRARADALASIVAEAVALRSKREEIARHASKQSIELARLLAERILGEELRLSPERIQSLAAQVLREAGAAPRAVLYAHPQDAKHLRPDVLSEATLVEALEIVEDPQLAPGNVRVETELGTIDGDLGSQLRYLTERLAHLMD